MSVDRWKKHQSTGILKNGAQRGYVIGLVGFALAASIFPVRAETLSEAYRRALKQDPVFDSARYALEAAQERLPQARAGLLPNVNAGFNASSQKGDASFSDAPYMARDARTRGWSLQLNQPLFRLANWIAYDQADAQIRQADAQFSQAQQDVVLRVAQAYFDVLVAEESLSVAQTQLNAVEQQLGLAKRNFDVGVSTITDTYEAKSRFDLATSQRIAAMNDLVNKRAEYERVTGEEPRDLLELRQDISLPKPTPPDLPSWLAAAREQNPLVRVQLAAQEVAKKEIAKNRAGHAPTLDMTASYGRNYSSGSLTSPADIDTRARSTQIGVQLNIPIYSGGATESKVREAASNYYKARADWETATRQAATSAKQAFTAFDSGQSQIDALQSAVESSRSSVEANKVGYRIGTRINIDVLNAEQQLASAQRDLVKTKYETLMQGLRLKASAGLLVEQDVYQIDALMVRKPSSIAQ
ncbi:TolC family outer membrane protein [Herbaspirillum sp. WKF16]|uniref:TolC family outer membrane protein n=1 Tax=Herbaspirillum sp. WKF16 TaxID=3028312 RepID=UPI0023A9F1BB|nr:TolC family outer membrane protein [Herbaspirillum sp. WKF16]WDZ98133.1 TolC family outer membrane protein [Herbaspirillum sp. WKF16]